MTLQLMKMDYQRPEKENSKKMIKSKISHHGNQWYKTKSSKLSKRQEINNRKKITKEKNMLCILKCLKFSY